MNNDFEDGSGGRDEEERSPLFDDDSADIRLVCTMLELSITIFFLCITAAASGG